MTFPRMTREQARKLSVAEQHEWFQQQRSRRSVLKGGIVGAGSLLGVEPSSECRDRHRRHPDPAVVADPAAKVPARQRIGRRPLRPAHLLWGSTPSAR